MMSVPDCLPSTMLSEAVTPRDKIIRNSAVSEEIKPKELCPSSGRGRAHIGDNDDDHDDYYCDSWG